jgi:oligopeptide transport system substrate-binding protein
MRIIILIVFFLYNCSVDDNKTSKVDEYSKKGILLLGNGTEPSGIDPHIVTGVPEHKILLALLEGLVVFNPKDNGVLPGVASNWEISEDGLEYTFTFNKNARWTNGDNVLPSDFEYSWKRILSSELGAQYADMLYVIKNAENYHKGKLNNFSEVGVSSIGNKLKVVLENPTPYFLNILTHYATWPVHPETVEKHGGMLSRSNQWTKIENFVGNGPFVLESWEINKSLKVKRNELYWGNSKNKINGIEFIPIDNELTQDRLFRSGGIHLANTVPTEKIKGYRENRPDVLFEHNYFGTYYYRINTTKYPLNNINFRKALSLSIDRELLIKSILKGNQIASYSFTPPNSQGYDPKTQLEFNPKKAKLFLDNSGYDIQSPPIELLYNTSEGHQKIAQAIQEMWKKYLGLNIVLTNVDWKVYLSRETQGEYDISRAGWIGDYPDPFTFLDMMVTDRGNNKTGWSSKEYDKFLKLASSKINNDSRYKLYEQAEKILIEELPIIPIYTYTRTYLLSQKVKNWQKNILDTNPYQFLSLE